MVAAEERARLPLLLVAVGVEAAERFAADDGDEREGGMGAETVGQREEGGRARGFGGVYCGTQARRASKHAKPTFREA